MMGNRISTFVEAALQYMIDSLIDGGSDATGWEVDNFAFPNNFLACSEMWTQSVHELASFAKDDACKRYFFAQDC